MSTPRIVACVVAGLVASFALGIGIWVFRVATSEVKGQGDATIRKNSAENWTKAQARFESLYAEIVATDRKITVAKAALDANPDDRTAADTYFGTQNVCLSFVADYIAEALDFSALTDPPADWAALVHEWTTSVLAPAFAELEAFYAEQVAA